MSLILDALNRSRDNVDPVPTLATHHPVEPVPAGARQYVVFAVLALAALLIAWLLWSRFSQPPPPVDTGSPVAALTRNIGSAATAVTTELKARADARWEAAQPGAVQPAPPPAETAPAEEPGARDVPSREAVAAPVVNTESGPRTTAVEDPAVARLYRDRTVPEAPPAASSPGSRSAAETREQPVDIEEVLKLAQQEIGNEDLDDHPVPLLTNLSQQNKDAVPTIYYRHHDYSSQPGKSTVELNGKTLSVGGSPGAGIKVEEILPDSVVLSYRGTQFRLKALNSWVNL
jgi:hypothetical protein